MSLVYSEISVCGRKIVTDVVRMAKKLVLSTWLTVVKSPMGVFFTTFHGKSYKITSGFSSTGVPPQLEGMEGAQLP